MSFNFAISSDSAVRNSRRPLAPWEIHDVKFKGAEIREFNGKKDPNAHYKLLSIKYENEDGYFNVDLFFLKMVMMYDQNLMVLMVVKFRWLPHLRPLWQ